MSTTFDYLDAFYLANTFTVPRLRHEIEHSERRLKMRDIFQGTPYEDLIGGKSYPELDWASFYSFPYEDYIQTCWEAITAIQKHTKQNPSPAAPGNRIDIAAIKSRNDIVTVVEGYTQLRKSGHNRFTGRCPLHEDKHPSMTVYADNQSWYCFQCGKGGDIFDFIMAVNACDFKQAAAILGGL